MEIKVDEPTDIKRLKAPKINDPIECLKLNDISIKSVESIENINQIATLNLTRLK